MLAFLIGEGGLVILEFKLATKYLQVVYGISLISPLRFRKSLVLNYKKCQQQPPLSCTLWYQKELNYFKINVLAAAKSNYTNRDGCSPGAILVLTTWYFV
jgi:hypothetical protein